MLARTFWSTRALTVGHSSSSRQSTTPARSLRRCILASCCVNSKKSTLVRTCFASMVKSTQSRAGPSSGPSGCSWQPRTKRSSRCSLTVEECDLAGRVLIHVVEALDRRGDDRSRRCAGPQPPPQTQGCCGAPATRNTFSVVQPSSLLRITQPVSSSTL